MLGFAALLALATALLFSFAPALHLSRVDLMQVLRLSGSAETATPRTARMRALLVAIEVALVVVLLAGATLMQRTLAILAGLDPGFRADGLIAVPLIQPRGRYAFAAAITGFATGWSIRCRRQDGVGTGAAWRGPSTTPVRAGRRTSPCLIVRSRRARSPRRRPRRSRPSISQTMGIPLVRGRDVRAGGAAGRTGLRHRQPDRS